ncbi:MAG: hydroxymethylglutaryl-CoA synthase family protein [Chloroflexi bacterium]|nr:hydroxymethylglutaryl-CoA synthase family protein [Chloroflexota bacterium]MBM3175108.1 hydroxymethylglutaryl-CoA synthase family protein [Chloroflexota bacterium]MBM4450195.1 hydroxymethylglutaryl-CoA synthase family protein [Chloroflexota bacterium]
MAGIVSYGAYIPRYRISRKTIFNAVGFMGTFPGPGEKAVANWNEDSITMAVAAGLDCLTGQDRKKMTGLNFATTTQPYMVRQNSAIASAALDLPDGITTADFVGCTKSGTTALISAFNAITRDKEGNIIVCAAECRAGKPGGAQEHLYGDAAASFLLGNDDVIATFEGSYSVSYDFPGRWRSVGEKFEHAWEDRFIRDEGYTKIIPEAITGLIKKYNLNIKDFSKIIYPCLYPREHTNIAKQLGADTVQIQPSILDTIGDPGSASPLMMLVAALEDAKAGDRILVASFGSGSDALFFTVTDKIDKAKNRNGFKKSVAAKKELTSYEKYLAFHNILPVEVGIRGEEIPFTQLSTLWRDRKLILSLHGSKCKRCGTPQYPPQRVCVNPDCSAIDEMEDYIFYDKKATVFTYTGDNLAPSIDPPAIYGIIDFEGGGRFWFDFTDCDLDQLKVGIPVQMTFRRKALDEARGQHVYFWYAMPTNTKETHDDHLME